MIPIRIATRHKLWGEYEGFSFFIFIFYWKGTPDKRTILNHELIHFHQQLELLFIFHWLLYMIFYMLWRMEGKDHDTAYREIPFEKEAYTYEHDMEYIRHRRAYQWITYL